MMMVMYRSVQGQPPMILSLRSRLEGLHRPLINEYLYLRQGQIELFRARH